MNKWMEESPALRWTSDNILDFSDCSFLLFAFYLFCEKRWAYKRRRLEPWSDHRSSFSLYMGFCNYVATFKYYQRLGRTGNGNSGQFRTCYIHILWMWRWTMVNRFKYTASIANTLGWINKKKFKNHRAIQYIFNASHKLKWHGRWLVILRIANAFIQIQSLNI